MDDFSKFVKTEHMLRWFADEPYLAIRSNIEEMLKAQVPDSHLKELQVLSEPQWLTGARRSDADSNNAILVRCGFAFEFHLVVESQGESHQLTGVFTWVAVCLDQPGQHKHRFWLDIDGTLETFGSEGELMERVYFELSEDES